MVTIKDISQKTGFSIATVSKAINYTGRIPEETRKIVLKAAEELGYVPNHSARLLKTTKSWTIGIIYEGNAKLGLYHPFYSRILEFFRKEVESNGYDLLFLSQYFGAIKLSYLEHAKMKGVDGILVLCGPMNDPRFTEIFQSNLPTVVIDHVSPDTTTITSQTQESFIEAIRQIKALGHRDIAYIHGPTNSYIGGLRMRDFKYAMNYSKINIREDLMIHSDFYTNDDGHIATRKLLALNNRPTAIFCSSDDVALGAIDELKQYGIRVPEDISVIGFDGIRNEKYGDIRVGYIKQHLVSIGESAAHELLDQINSKKKQKDKVIYIDTEFVKNDTVGPCCNK